MKLLIVCMLGLAVCLVNATKEKRNALYLRPYSPLRRQAWKCHPGCRKFCLPSCKKSCCNPSAPNYTPQMFPQLIQYQSNIPNPPQLPPACPANCNPSCYPSCDAGCCATQPPPPSYNSYGSNGACSPACAPAYNPACCHSQSIQLHSRPMVPGAPVQNQDRVEAHAAPAPAPPAPKPKAKPTNKEGQLCVRKCQNLCDPRCKFECCLPTHKYFDDDPKPPPPPPVKHYKPKVDRRKEELKNKLRDPQYIHPIAGPQRAPFPSVYRATPSRTAPCQGQEPCGSMTPTTSPFGATTDPFGSSTDMYGMMSSPYTQGYATQSPQGACAASCPQSCAPSCTPSCCETQAPPPQAPPMTPQAPLMMPQAPPMMPFAPPMMPQMPMPPQMPFGPGPMGPMHASSPGLSPLGRAPTTCSAGCSNICSPACSQTCCQEFPQVVHVPPATAASAIQRASSPGLAPLGQASTTCPGMCPNACAPSCNPMCCASAGLAPQVVHVAPVHLGPPAAPMHAGSPGLHPLGQASTCPGACSNACAPSCSTSCCAAQAPPMTCPNSCSNSCAPACSSSCCSRNDQLLPANWDRRSSIKRLWRRY